MLLSVSERTFHKEVLQSSQPVLVHFWAPWCGLCRMLEPLLCKVLSELEHPVKIVRINADENLRLANTYRLKSLPTLLLFEQGHLRERIDGFEGREGLQPILDKMLVNVLVKSA
jgi:thioredoxin 1